VEITSDQIRAARVLLRLQQAELAVRAGVSIATLRRLESGQGGKAVAAGTVNCVREVLEKAGAEFIPDGVRRRRARRLDAAELYEDLRSISLRSAARLLGRDLMTDRELYDENGLPR
jgi:transcriptional regulator with XRE-family HTH domain